MFPFQLGLYFRVVFGKTHLKGGGAKRLLIRLLFLTLYPLWVLSTFCFMLFDRVFLPSYRKFKVERPVFIVGNPRSGTTYLHRLLATDSESFLAPKLWQILAPASIQLRIVKAFAAVDRAIGSPIKKTILAIEKVLFKRTEKIHKMSLMSAEEDEGYFLHIFAAVFLAIAFPSDSIRGLADFDNLPQTQRSKLMSFYHQCIQRLMQVMGNKRRLLSKNPSFTTKMLSLPEHFPDAHIIYIVRHPTESLCSIQSMFLKMFEAQGLKIPEGESRRRGRLVDLMISYYEHAAKVLDNAPEGSYSIVRYEDLTQDPLAAVEKIYQGLKQEISPAYRAELEKIRDANRSRVSKHSYTLEEFDMTHEEVEQRLGFVYDKFGYERRSIVDAA